LTATSDFKIREVCIYNSAATANPNPINPSLTALFRLGELWNTINKNGYFGWNQNSGTNLMPLTTVGSTDVGEANWGTTSPLPSDQHYNLHISDNLGLGSGGICPKGTQSTGPWTCFVDPDFVPNGQIPEFPTIALPIAAVIGLVFFFQHKKRKEE
jgi:hypothetical protein